MDAENSANVSNVDDVVARGALPPASSLEMTNVEISGPTTATMGILTRDNEMEELRTMWQQQNTLLTAFIQQQGRINELFLKKTEANLVLPNSQNSNSGVPILLSGEAGKNPSTGPVLVATPASSEVGVVNIPSVAHINNDYSTNNLPVTADKNDLGEDWKRVALAFTTRAFQTATVEKPIFRTADSQHPVLFIQRLERFINSTGASPTHALDVAKDCILGPASDWWNIAEGSWSTFQQFKDAFLQYFWSEERQHSERVRLGNVKYSPLKKLSMTEFFLRQVTSYRLFSPTLPESLIVSEIMRQLPINVQSLWATVSNRTLAGALEFLERQVAIAGKRFQNTDFQSPVHKEVSAVVGSSSITYKRQDNPTTAINSRVPPPTFSKPPPSICTCCLGRVPNSSEN